MPYSIEQYTNSIAAYLPKGRLYDSAWIKGKNSRELLRGFAYELLNLDNKIEEILAEHDINNTVRFLEEWESAVGIPDDCFSIDPADTVETRRNRVLAKILAIGTQTEEDFRIVAEKLGFTIAVTQDVANFKIIISYLNLSPGGWPWGWPHLWGGPSQRASCLLSKLKPAYTTMSFVYYPYTVENNISVGTNPIDVAFDGTYIWVADLTSNDIKKIDPSTDTVIHTIALPLNNPQALLWDGANLWCALGSGKRVYKIDVSTNSIIGTITISGDGSDLEIDKNGFLWVSESTGTISEKINRSTNTVIGSVLQIGKGVKFDGEYLWISDDAANKIYKVDVDTNTVIGNVTVGTTPIGMEIDKYGFIWVANSADGTLSKVDVVNGVVVKTIAVGSGASSGPIRMSIGASSGDLFCSLSPVDDAIAIINTYDDSILKTLSVGNNPQGMAPDTNAGHMWISNFGSNTVSKVK